MAEPAPGEIQAAGAVLWRARAGRAETALVHRPRYDDWSFPKGKSLPGEHVLLTAVREVEEETGVRVALGRRLGSQSYLADGQPKRVEYWAARPVSPERFAPNDEVDALAWVPLAAAREQLSYTWVKMALQGAGLVGKVEAHPEAETAAAESPSRSTRRARIGTTPSSSMERIVSRYSSVVSCSSAIDRQRRAGSGEWGPETGLALDRVECQTRLAL